MAGGPGRAKKPKAQATTSKTSRGQGRSLQRQAAPTPDRPSENSGLSPRQQDIARRMAQALERQDARTVADMLRALTPNDRRMALTEAMRSANIQTQLSAEGILAAMTSNRLPQSIIDAARTRVPAGPWNPPGQQPIPYYIGTEGHNAIAAHYAAAHAGDLLFLNHTPLSTAIRRMGGRVPSRNETWTQEMERLKPDILNATRRHLYEIKPRGSEALAASEAALYLGALARAGITVTLGPTGEPGTKGVVPGPGGYYAFESTAPGVIVYQKRNGDYDPQTVTVPETQPQRESNEDFLKRMERLTHLTGWALILYLVISEGSRVAFPPRHLVPVP